MKSNLKGLKDGTLTVQQIIRDCLVLIIGKGEKQPDETTKIDPKLIKIFIEDFKKFGDATRRPCYFDSESNLIKNGINLRTSHESDYGTDSGK